MVHYLLEAGVDLVWFDAVGYQQVENSIRDSVAVAGQAEVLQGLEQQGAAASAVE
jgi:hypothetical protein